MIDLRMTTAVLIAALGVGCRSGDATGPAESRFETFRLSHGSTHALADGSRISFVELIHESRCPRHVVCVWAGQASIGLELQRGGQKVAVRATIPGTAERVDSTRADSSGALGYAIQLLQLDPYPADPGTPDPHQYVAHLRVGRRN